MMSMETEFTRPSTLSVTVTAQMRHGVLWECRNKCGSVLALIRYLQDGTELSLHATEVGRWVNLRNPPSRGWLEKHGLELEQKVMALLGRYVTVDEMFPEEMRDDRFGRMKTRVEVTHDVPIERLIAAGVAPRLLQSPVEEVEISERNSMIREVLATLTPREEKVIKMRFGLDGAGEHTLEEVSQHFGFSKERVRQIEARALRKLRHPSRSRSLKDMLGDLGNPVYIAAPTLVKPPKKVRRSVPEEERFAPAPARKVKAQEYQYHHWRFISKDQRRQIAQLVFTYVKEPSRFIYRKALSAYYFGTVSGLACYLGTLDLYETWEVSSKEA